MKTPEQEPERDLAPACRRVRAGLERLVDDALPELEAARDQGHLEACSACRAESDRWLALLASIRAAAAADRVGRAGELVGALEGLDVRLDQAAATASRRRLRRIAGHTAASLATVAAAVVCLFALELGGLGPTEAGPRSAEAFLPRVELGLPDWTRMLDFMLAEEG